LLIIYCTIFPLLEFTRKDDLSRQHHQPLVMKMISRPFCSVMLVSFEFSLLSIPLSSSPPLSVTFALLTITFSSTRALRTPYRNNLSVYDSSLFLTLGCCDSLPISLSYALRLRTALAVCLLRILTIFLSLSPILPRCVLLPAKCFVTSQVSPAKRKKQSPDPTKRDTSKEKFRRRALVGGNTRDSFSCLLTILESPDKKIQRWG